MERRTSPDEFCRKALIQVNPPNDTGELFEYSDHVYQLILEEQSKKWREEINETLSSDVVELDRAAA